MKKLLSIILPVGLFLVPNISRAGSDGATITGALLGAATGLIVANNADVSRYIAVPAGALLGGIVGHAAANHRWSDYGRYDRGRYGYYGPGSYYDPYYHESYPYYGRPGYYEPPRVVIIRDQRKHRPQAPEPANLQPGVDLVKVSVQFSSGVYVDVPILRTGNKYVGPQGEEYQSLPTAKELAEKYAK